MQLHVDRNLPHDGDDPVITRKYNIYGLEMHPGFFTNTSIKKQPVITR